jgi:hypothetical protein
MEIIESLVLFCFGSIGVTHILVDGEIFKPVKEFIAKNLPEFFSKLLNCYQCTGFWVGIFFGFFLYFDVENITKSIVYLFLAGGSSSNLSYFWALVLTYLEANSLIRMNNNSNEQS